MSRDIRVRAVNRRLSRISRRGRSVAIAVWLLVAGFLAGCGVPASSPPTTITEVPYNLMEPAPPPTPRTSEAATRGPYIYWLDDSDRLYAVEAGAAASEDAAAATVLARLSQGPSELERMSGLSTALGPDVQLTLNSITDGLAEVEVQTGDPAPSARRLPHAVGQIVLSLASVPGIDSVLLTVDGERIEAPLPDGVLTAGPLTAEDFAVLAADNAPIPGARATQR